MEVHSAWFRKNAWKTKIEMKTVQLHMICASNYDYKNTRYSQLTALFKTDSTLKTLCERTIVKESFSNNYLINSPHRRFSKLTTIGSDDGLSPGRRQAIF